MNIHTKHVYRWTLALIATAALAGAVAIFAWMQGVFLPKWIKWEKKCLTHFEDADAPDAIHLARRHLTVQADGGTVWESPDGVLVQDFLWCDINHDGANELILLCWRIGRYGDARPFWVDKDERTWSQHIYIYEWRGHEVHALWMASDIGMDAAAFAFDDKERLVITEASGRETCWDWISWGLTLIREKTPPHQ